MSFYAVANGRETGIFAKWSECQQQIKGYSGAVFKKFKLNDDAKQFIESYKNPPPPEDTDSESTDDKIYIYTDGACSNNGKKTAKAGIGVFVGENDKRNVSKKVDGRQTNNVAELTAIIEAYGIIEESKDMLGKEVVICSDSTYAINCATTYGEKQSKLNWEKDIPNKPLVKTIYELFKDADKITFKHVYAHTTNVDKHSLGNDAADKLANLSIGLTECPYSTEAIKKRIYLKVEFKDKEKVKALNGKWSKSNKKWFIYENNVNKDKVLDMFDKSS